MHLQGLAGGDVETLRKANDSALVVDLASGIDIAAVECDYGFTGLGSWGGVEPQLLQVKLAVAQFNGVFLPAALTVWLKRPQPSAVVKAARKLSCCMRGPKASLPSGPS